MPKHNWIPTLPNYQGDEWINPFLPTTISNWLDIRQYGWVIDGEVDNAFVKELTLLAKLDHWQWPSDLVVFVTDLHADAAAFSASLVASGLFARHGPQPDQITMVTDAPSFEIIIGGDCLDKGPANLPLLRLIRQLLDQEIRITLLSGNHDLRLQLAVNTLRTPNCNLNRHFLIRLGSKVMPLCVELLTEYPLTAEEIACLPTEAECLDRLLPSDEWPLHFRKEASPYLTTRQIHTELSRLTSRKQRFFRAAEKAQLSMQQIFAALERWRQLFLEPNGEFHWFIAHQQLACRRGSFVFLHAGCDDVMANRLAIEGLDSLNEEYRNARQGDAFHLYFSALGNMLRTKYRLQDPSLSPESRQALHQAGIHAFVHGHRNLHHGQRITFRANMLHFECDTTLNRVSRQEEGLLGHGAAVTLLDPQGWVMGISSDYESAKYFTPEHLDDFVQQFTIEASHE